MASSAARPELILASGSPYRRKMLEAAGLTFRTVPSDVDESALKRRLTANTSVLAPSAIARALAQAKAEAVSALHPDAIVIGADQVLAQGDQLFDKPGGLAAARAQLERLRGEAHRLISAVLLAQRGKAVWNHVDEARLTMRSFSPQFLESYLARAGAEASKIVGAYEIEGLGVQLFDRIEGDHFTIIGLPLVPLLVRLRACGVIDA